MYWTLLTTFLFFGSVISEREHKVHNIVLYPDKYSWCQITPIQQIITTPGYESVTIENNICVGACYSYSIPKTIPAEPGEIIGPYCDSCQPSEIKCYHVTLRASDKNSNGPKTIQKRVEIITGCNCKSCDAKPREDCDLNTLELPVDLFTNQENATKKPEIEVPELLHVSPDNFGQQQKQSDVKLELNSKLIDLIKSLPNEADPNKLKHGKTELKELLKLMENSENELNDENLIHFIKLVNMQNSENFDLNLDQLKDILNKFKKNQGMLKKHLYWSDSINANAKIEADIKKLGEKVDLPDNFGIEGSRAGMPPHLRGSHISMGIKHNSEVDISKSSPTLDVTSEELILSHSKHHYLGEKQHAGFDDGHLVKGPHGSMALLPDKKVEKKISLKADDLKPNHDGVVVTYGAPENNSS